MADAAELTPCDPAPWVPDEAPRLETGTSGTRTVLDDGTLLVPPKVANDDEIRRFIQREYRPFMRNALDGFAAPTGATWFWVRIAAMGEPVETEMARSSGHVELDRIAHRAVARVRFAPAVKGDCSVDVWALIPVRFACFVNGKRCG